jgi:hypothetical protein
MDVSDGRPKCIMNNKDATSKRLHVHVQVETTSISTSDTMAGGVTEKQARTSTSSLAEDKKARRRRMHAEADRVRRAKERNEIEALQAQVLTMSKMNQSLLKEKQRLERLVEAAMNMTNNKGFL